MADIETIRPVSGRIAGTLLALALACAPGLALADSPADAPTQSETWNTCRQAAAKVEQARDLPAALLQAMTIVETGRRAPSGQVEAWPWTINSEGRGYHFTSKDEAVWAVRRLMADGVRSIDVGCMQVNLRYHPRAFTSLEEAFDPMANVAYAASFLTRLKDRHGKWEQATARYHSYNKALRERYASRVEKVLARERTQLAEKAGLPAPGPAAEGDPIQTASVGGTADLGLRPSLVPGLRRTLGGPEETAPARKAAAADPAAAPTAEETRLASAAE